MDAEPVPTGYGTVRDLVEQAVEQAGVRYLFVEHTVLAHRATPFRCHRADLRSFLVIEGRIGVEAPAAGSTGYGYLEGWHAPPGSVYRFRAVGGPAVVLEAGSVRGGTRETVEPEPPGARLCPVSSYTVTKPWGYEIWYTANLTDPPYALKQIHMSAGHQSSLQSHQHKSETNYVIEGEATVLNGLLAPDDPSVTVDAAALPLKVHGPRSGWSSAPRVLHRVIARSDYTSVEVSTPELDDVIRWQDDTGRPDGRIDAEHRAGRR